MMKHRTLIFLLAIAVLRPTLAQAADLKVDVSGLRSSDGKVMIGVYNSRDSFLKSVAVAADLPAALGDVHYVFKDLAPGDYTVAVFHDLNGNGRLDKRPDGIPDEPAALSRGARSDFGPPRYEDAVFTLPEGGTEIGIRLFE